ncbi:MAG: metallophosphoesterase, partial [Clostridia bacterium]|nr:metallophosphoesterase [Clostridia bacterium]
MKRLISLLAVLLVLSLCACSVPGDIVTDTTMTDLDDTSASNDTTEPDTAAPETTAPETAAPETDADTEAETSPACTHADADDNGLCDLCTLSVLVSVDFYSVNDLHGKFFDTDDQPGVDELTTFFKTMQATNPNTVLLSTGDMWQGSSESNLTKGLILTDWMNELDFAAMTLGNHEFDWGVEAILVNAELAEFPILAINIYERDTNTLADYCTPSVLVDKGEVQIGIIGAIGNCYSSISADKVQDYYFVLDDALTELVKAESKALRAQGADIIVYAMHDGGGAYDYSLSGDYVDIVFEGHSHQNYIKKDSEGIYHLQGGGDNDGITHAVAKVNSVTGTVIVTTAEYMPTSRYQSFEDDPIVEQLGEKYADALAAGNEMLGYNAQKRYSEQILQKVADLYLAYGQQRWGEQYDIVLGGGFL